VNTFFSVLFGRSRWGIDRIGSVFAFKNNISFQDKVKLIDRVSNRVHMLILLVLFKLKKLNVVSDLLAQGIEYEKFFNPLGHLIEFHACYVNILILVFGVLDLDNDCIFCNG
jgi:hypothetical protein